LNLRYATNHTQNENENKKKSHNNTPKKYVFIVMVRQVGFPI